MTRKMLSICFESKNHQSTNIFGAVIGAVTHRNIILQFKFVLLTIPCPKVDRLKSFLISAYFVASNAAGFDFFDKL